MSEYYEDATVITADVDGDGHADIAFVDLDNDGYADKVIVAVEREAPENYDGGREDGYEAGYDGTERADAYEAPGYDGDPYQAGNTYANDYTDTAVSSSADGSEGYINVGDGQFVSWG